MQFFSVKIRVLGLALIAFSYTATGLLTGCSSVTSHQSSTPHQTTTEVGTQPEGAPNHAGDNMNHGHNMNQMMSMDLGPADSDYDLRFIDGMILHHQGAIEMAKEVLNQSQRPEIKKLANDIIASQNQEIQAMKQWRQAWYPQADSKPVAYSAQMGHQTKMTPEQGQEMMMKTDLGATDSQFDLRFINAMIPHHQGAVVMAQDALNKSKRPEIQKLAQAIIADQQREITQMQQWRKAWYQQ
ncbi:MAG: DUF305 domain-containing protein [Actinomycetota bacterium]